MDQFLTLRILSPSKEARVVQCKEVYFPGIEGQFGVLLEHARLVAELGS